MQPVYDAIKQVERYRPGAAREALKSFAAALNLPSDRGSAMLQGLGSEGQVAYNLSVRIAMTGITRERAIENIKEALLSAIPLLVRLAECAS
jgi:hypothetical protein